MVHESAIVDEGAEIGAGTKIWHFSHVCSGARIGGDCVLGQNVYVASTVRIGDGVKIQNNVSVYDGVILEDGVFVGPSAVFTNVRHPRSGVNRRDSFETTAVRVGATIGANATIRCGVEIGSWAFIGAGALILDDVPAHALVVGNPSRIIGWACTCGERLPADLLCARCGRRFEVRGEELEELL